MTSRVTEAPTCPGYTGAGRSDPPPRVRFDDGWIELAEAGGQTAVHPALHESIGGWTLMAVFSRAGRSMAVFEELQLQAGRLAFVAENGLLRLCPKSLEPTSEAAVGLAFHGIDAWYRGHRKEDVLPDHRDVLREELLASGDDPSPEAVAECYPAARHAFFEGHLRPHTFVGTPMSSDVVPLYYQDVTMVSRVPIGVAAPGSEPSMADGNIWEGLVGGWTPIVRTVYPLTSDEAWEVIACASSATANDFQQPVWYRFVRLKAGRPVAITYVDSFLPHPHAGADLRDRFYAELLETLDFWDDHAAGGMEVVGWDWLAERARHAFAREAITRHGVHPKYGIADQAYAGAEHDGFQDVLVSSVLGCLEWGYHDRARAYLDDYLTNFVRHDATLRYRGPEMGKYGVMLTCLGRYYDYTRDSSLLLKQREKVDAIADMLLGRWRKARELAPDDPAYGMICGYHEADINFLTPNVYELDYDRPYLSNTGEAWRGLRDLGSALTSVARERSDEELARRGSMILEAAAAIFEDARRGVERSWLTKDGVTGLPIIAGDRTFYWEHPYRARPESYDENRVWSELFFGGAASEQTVRRIWDIAGERGHTTLGVFNNRKSLVGFLVWEEIAGLLQHDMVPEALLVFYAQAIHAHSRGTWTAIECVDMDRTRGAHSPYCLPAQMTLPIAAKWLLVHEDPISGAITLAHGVPRDRLADGEVIGVRKAPTRRGDVGFLMRSRIESGQIDCEVTLPQRPGATIRLRIRAPRRWGLTGAHATSPIGLPLTVDRDYVLLPSDASGTVAFTTTWHRQDTTAR